MTREALEFFLERLLVGKLRLLPQQDARQPKQN